ncbi:MAG: glutathione peroxidase [Chitinophagaceae bacterium]|nr:glutathione peroxidase [Chitinophagaceae bacterium]
MNFHELHFKNLLGKEISFSEYKGKVCLVVNIASHCGLTPQLHDLETLYIFYRKKGFEVLAFPSNDFGSQEPLGNSAIGEFCKDRFLSSFSIFEKSHVKGKDTNPVFRYLSSRKMNGKFSIRPLWNFQKYLIDKEGNLQDFFFPFTKPTANRLMKKIERLL